MWGAEGSSTEGRRYIRILQLRWLLRDVARSSVRALLARDAGLCAAAAELCDNVNQPGKVS